jgi:ferredoxin
MGGVAPEMSGFFGGPMPPVKAVSRPTPAIETREREPVDLNYRPLPSVPVTRPRFPVAVVNATKCTACGTCEESCAVEAITVDNVARINPQECIGCGVCAADCPEEAISMKIID